MSQHASSSFAQDFALKLLPTDAREVHLLCPVCLHALLHHCFWLHQVSLENLSASEVFPLARVLETRLCAAESRNFRV